jgi:hypothetical protein
MAAMDKQSLKPIREQIIYANLLLIGMVTGIIILIVTYSIYVTGLLPSHVEMQVISANWGKGIHDYLEITHSPHGWSWLHMLGKGRLLKLHRLYLAGRADHHLLPRAGQGLLPAEKLDLHGHQCFGNCRAVPGGIRITGQRRALSNGVSP